MDQKIIEDWFKSYPSWVKEAVVSICDNKEQLDTFIPNLLVSLKKYVDTKKQIDESQDSHDESKISYVINTQNDKQTKTYIKSISEIININSIKPSSSMIFGKNLSLIYGLNGSGKSSYIRILKVLTNRYDFNKILPNIYSDQDNGCQSFKVNFSKDEKIFSETFHLDSSEKQMFIGPIEHNINGSIDTSYKCNVDVFDTDIEQGYLDQEFDMIYSPWFIVVFEKLIRIFNKLNKELLIEKENLVSKLPEKNKQFSNTQHINDMYSPTLYNIENIREKFTFTENDNERLEDLENLNKNEPSVLKQKYEDIINETQNVFNSIKRAIECTSPDKINKLNNLKADYLQNKKSAQEALNVLKDGEFSDNYGSKTWKIMWEAAKKFSTEEFYPESDFPYIGSNSKCIFCNQILTNDAKTRLIKLNNFVSGEVENLVNTSKKKIDDYVENFPISPSTNDIEKSVKIINLNQEYLLKEIVNFWENYNNFIELHKQNITPQIEEKQYNIRSILLHNLESILIDYRNKINNLPTNYNPDNKQEIILQISELNAKKWASSYVTNIEEEAKILKEKAKITQYLKETQTNNISKQLNLISTQYITNDYVENFNQELENLGAKNIKVSLKKTKVERGQIKHQIKLTRSNVLIKNILSEGEQRVISLAAFITNVTTNNYNNILIFDDPISSLDQKYEKKVAERLAELSHNQQVIVFTHRLSLCGYLLQLQSDLCNIYITYNNNECGLVSNIIPNFIKRPITAIQDLKNMNFVQAKRLQEEGNITDYEINIRSICNELRKLLERIIEVDFFLGIIERHKPGVTTLNKINKISRIDEEDCNFINDLMTKLSCFEHSQSSEAPEDIPDNNTLDKIFNDLISWHKKFKEKMKD